MKGKIIGISGVALVILAIIGFSTMFTVNQIQQVLVLQFGDPKQMINEPGLKFKLPFVQDVVYYDKRILDYDHPLEEIIASDQKRLVVDAFARYRIVDPLKFFQSVRTESAVRDRLSPLMSGALRRVIGNVSLSTVLSEERERIMLTIRDQVNTEAKQFGIMIKDVRIRRADLPEANSQAIYERMKSEREREAREFRAQGAELGQRIRSRADREKTVILAQAKKQGETLRGEGEAESTRIYAEAFGTDPEFFSFYRSMQAYRKALGNSDTTMILSPESDFFRYFGTMSGNKAERSR